MKFAFIALVMTLGLSSAAQAEAAFEIPKGKVAFASPKDGETVSSPVKLKMTVTGLKLRPAGEAPNDHSSGHHHLIVDGMATPVGAVVPADATHIHFGKAQTEASLPLAPGPHTLTLQLADGAHRSYGPTLSQTIRITVK